MKCILFFLSLLCLFSPTARGEVLESNVTLTYKLHAGHTRETRSGVEKESYSVVSFKTSDVIHQIGLKTTNNFSPKARLIHKTITYSSGPSESFYIIRDPILGDFNATRYFDFVIESMSKKSTIKSDATGTTERAGHATFDIRIVDIREGLYGSGPATIKARNLASKQFPGTLMNPTTSSYTTYGNYKLGAPDNITSSYATGTIKHSAPKITLTPTES